MDSSAVALRLATITSARRSQASRGRSLFLVGEKDPPSAAMREIHKQLKGSQFVEIAGAGHISNIEQPEAFTRAVEGFLMT